MTYDMGDIGKAFDELLSEAAKKNEKIISSTLRKAPNRFQRAAIAFYRKVLKRRSGNLVRSIHGFFSQNISTKEYELGLRAGGEVAKYAYIQHEGGHTRPHIIRVRVAKALRWYGGKMTKSGRVSKAKGNTFFAKSVRHPGSYIKPKKYLQFPLKTETEKISKELLEKITL